jgi:hypothetical protein
MLWKKVSRSKEDHDMLTETEHLISVLAEEAGEIVHACGKALRFGLDDGYPGTDRTNAGDIALEVAHLKAVAVMLGLNCDGQSERSAIDAKINKVHLFMKYARQRGTLPPRSERITDDAHEPE